MDIAKLDYNPTKTMPEFKQFKPFIFIKETNLKK